VGGKSRGQDRGPREIRRVGFRLGFLARVLYFPCLIFVGRGGAPGLSAFLSDLLVYGFIALLAFRFFSPFLRPVTPDRLLYDVLAPTPVVASFVAPAVTPDLPDEIVPGSDCWVLCPAGVDCDALQMLNPACRVRQPGH